VTFSRVILDAKAAIARIESIRRERFDARCGGPHDPLAHAGASRLARMLEDRRRERRQAAEKAATQLHRTIRRAVQAELRCLGYAREKTTGSGSNYYQRWDDAINDWSRVRIADHTVPETAERAHNVAHGGFSWSTCGVEIIIPDHDSPAAAVAELRELLGLAVSA